MCKKLTKLEFASNKCATHVEKVECVSTHQRKAAFTLAEVLITLGIIGIVAALTFPTLMESVTERRNSERHANIAYKVTQAMELMKAHGELSKKYETTEAFVDELQKYLKISKRCDANHIAECWPTATVTDTSGNEFEVSEAKTGRNLQIQGSKTSNVGLVLADGAAIILNYNPPTKGIDIGDAVYASKIYLPVGGGKTKEFAYTTSVTSPIDFVMDVNGRNRPNSETINGKYHDIRSFKSAKFGKGCTAVVNGQCVIDLGTNYSPINCLDKTTDDYTKYCGSYPGYFQEDYWAGAKKACTDIGMKLPGVWTIFGFKGKSGLPNTGMFWCSEGGNYREGCMVDIGRGYSNGYSKNNQLGVLCIGN